MAVKPEMIGDVDEGTPSGSVNDQGLTADEQAQFDAMKDSETTGGDDAPGDDTPSDDVDPNAPPVDPNASPAVAAPPAVVDEDDEPDGPAVVDPKTGKQQKTVSYGKHQRLLTKAEQRAQQALEASNQAKIDNARLAERLAILNEALTAPPPPDPAAARAAEVAANPMLEETIDPAVDAIQALAQLQRRQTWMNENQNSFVEQTTATQEDTQLLQSFQSDTTAYAATEEGKHFMGTDGAYQFLKNSRLIELGISLFDKDPTDPNVQFTPAEVNKMVTDFNAEEKWVVANAIKQKKSPAQAIMKLARGRGWKVPEAAPAGGAPAAPAAAAAQPGALPGKPGGIPATPAARAAPAAPGARSAVAQIQAEAAAAAASRSLSDGGGAPPPVELTPEVLLKMDDAEFGAYVDSLPKGRLDAIMGR